MTIRIIVFLFSLVISTVYGKEIDCSKHPIYNQIVKNRPAISKSYAFKLSNIIYKVSKKYNISSDIFTAILAQESGYKVGAKGYSYGVIELTIKEYNHELAQCLDKITVEIHKKAMVYDYTISVDLCKDRIKKYKKVRTTSDFGISQINYRTAFRLGLDLDRLTTDIEYSVEAGAIVLSDFKRRYGKREPNTWHSRYNASNKIKRKIYQELVARYLRETST